MLKAKTLEGIAIIGMSLSMIVASIYMLRGCIDYQPVEAPHFIEVELSESEYRRLWTNAKWNHSREICGNEKTLHYVGENLVVCRGD